MTKPHGMRARDNPFRVDRLHSLGFRPQGFTWKQLLSRLSAHDYRVSIVGPEGTGKSALLEQLGHQLEALGHRTRSIRLAGGERRFLASGFERKLARELQGDEILLFDGGDHLGPIAWQRFRIRMRRAKGIVITNHNHTRLPTLVTTQTSPSLLRDLITELAPGNWLPRDELHALFTRTGGNVRRALRALYDRCADDGI